MVNCLREHRYGWKGGRKEMEPRASVSAGRIQGTRAPCLLCGSCRAEADCEYPLPCDDELSLAAVVTEGTGSSGRHAAAGRYDEEHV